MTNKKIGQALSLGSNSAPHTLKSLSVSMPRSFLFPTTFFSLKSEILNSARNFYNTTFWKADFRSLPVNITKKHCCQTIEFGVKTGITFSQIYPNRDPLQQVGEKQIPSCLQQKMSTIQQNCKTCKSLTSTYLAFPLP